MGEALRRAIAEFKKERNNQKLKKRFFALNPDYTYLKGLLDAMAEDGQRLKFIIKHPNGLVLEICRDTPRPQKPKDPYVEEIR
jgi:hypothetical protein